MRKPTKIIKPFAVLLTIFISSIGVSAQSLTQKMDAIVTSAYGPNAPGISILVAKEGKPIYRKAFGKSNLELDVNATPENVYEIGSITKQFTAVAILMLQEQGKLSVQDEITKYIPDYPTQGKKITIHQLLNHTSGIKSYTNMASFMNLARTDMTPTELIDKFKNEPMEFDPGTAFNYNNSGYILLGQIIEVVTGDTYENFIEQKIFEPLGMKNSRYGKMTEVIPNRANGYSEAETDSYVNANYLSLTLPYAAGSLMSTVDDLLIWQNAISANKLIKRSSLETAINGSTLSNGDKIEYGYGWGTNNIQGELSIAHSGGIFGYSTNGIYLPEQDIYVIGLTNCDCNDVGAITNKIAALAIGKPYPEPKDAVTVTEAEMQQWVGAYEFEDGAIRHITLNDDSLYSLREGSTRAEPFKIFPIENGNYFFEDGTISYSFSKSDTGERQATFTANGIPTVGKGIDKKAPSERESILVSEELLKEYYGKYELQPGFVFEVTGKGSQLFAQATGQPKAELFAETDSKFFLKVVPAEITFNKDDGKVSSLTLNQGGQQMSATKIE